MNLMTEAVTKLQGNTIPPGNIFALNTNVIFRPSYFVRCAKRNMKSPACAACRMQRKKCSEECLLAPYFPSDDPDKFAIVQRVFGTSNVIKMLQCVEDYERADAVKSMVYEASARVENPVHGCTSAIYQLQRQIAKLESQLAATQAELTNMRWQYDKLVLLVGTGYGEAEQVVYPADATLQLTEHMSYEEEDPLLLWEI